MIAQQQVQAPQHSSAVDTVNIHKPRQPSARVTGSIPINLQLEEPIARRSAWTPVTNSEPARAAAVEPPRCGHLGRVSEIASRRSPTLHDRQTFNQGVSTATPLFPNNFVQPEIPPKRQPWPDVLPLPKQDFRDDDLPLSHTAVSGQAHDIFPKHPSVLGKVLDAADNVALGVDLVSKWPDFKVCDFHTLAQADTRWQCVTDRNMRFTVEGVHFNSEEYNAALSLVDTHGLETVLDGLSGATFGVVSATKFVVENMDSESGAANEAHPELAKACTVINGGVLIAGLTLAPQILTVVAAATILKGIFSLFS